MSMSVSPAKSIAGPPQSGAIPVSGLLSLPGLVAIGMVISLVSARTMISGTMASGAFVDTDDAMRMAQVHDYMAGQGWYDLTAWRLDAPNGVFMHWSRLVDVPIAALIRLFALVTNAETADRLTRITVPLALLAGLFYCTARIAKMLAGDLGPLIAVFLTLLGGAIFGYFAPGRVDHDHFVILGLLLMTGALARALDPADRWGAPLAGAVIALNLAVSLETLPFVVIGVAAVPVAWVLQGAPFQRPLLAFSATLALGLLVAFLVVVGPSRYFNGACDTLSAAHLVAGLAGAVLCLALALLTPRLHSLPLRIGAAGLAGAATIAAVALTYPACLGDPYAHIDPLLKAVWLSHVGEARPMWIGIAESPEVVAPFAISILLGLAATIWAARCSAGVERYRFGLIVALVLAGAAASVWQIRVLGVVLPLAVFGLVWAIARICGPSMAAGKAYAVPMLLGACLLVSPLGYALVFPNLESADKTQHSRAETACRAPGAFTALASLPHGLMLSHIDTGAHLLARTSLGVVAAPFHRDEHGLRLAVDAFLANPAAAQAILRGGGVRYIIVCPGLNEAEDYRKIAPQGLAAQLDDGVVPPWLKPLTLDTPYRVLELR